MRVTSIGASHLKSCLDFALYQRILNIAIKQCVGYTKGNAGK